MKHSIKTQLAVSFIALMALILGTNFLINNFFLENEGIALSREKILNSVWNYDYFGDARTIDTHVKKLRSKMGDKGEYIKTVWGMGYKFEVDE